MSALLFAHPVSAILSVLYLFAPSFIHGFFFYVYGGGTFYLLGGVHAHRTYAEKPEDNMKELVLSFTM